MRYSFLLIACSMILSAAAPIPVLLLDGEQGGPYHAWQETTPYLKKMLDQTGLFDVTVLTAPAKGGDFSQFRPDFTRYRAVVLNYDAPDERWPDAVKESFEKYVSNGGGVVIFHAADNAFPKWKAFNLMIGMGGWRGRTEKDGPYWFYENGKMVADPKPGPAGSHGARIPFPLIHREPNHPILKGLPTTWMHAPDELYARMRGPGENMTVLATAYSDPANKGTGRHEPALMTLSYGKGRIFHTILGHDRVALNSVGFIVTFQRGTEWAATGKVKQKVPKDFPTATQHTTRPEFAVAAGK